MTIAAFTPRRWKNHIKYLPTGRSIEAGDVSKHNGVRTHGYGLCSLHLHWLQLWDVSIGVSCQHIAIQQHLLALQVPVFRSEMVLFSCKLGCFTKTRNVTKPSALLPCTLGLGAFARHVNAVCIVATEIDQEQSNPLLKILRKKVKHGPDVFFYFLKQRNLLLLYKAYKFVVQRGWGYRSRWLLWGAARKKQNLELCVDPYRFFRAMCISTDHICAIECCREHRGSHEAMP